MTDIKKWNESAAANNLSPPDGFPEGMDPGLVNNAAREVMAAVARDYRQSKQWVDYDHSFSFVDSTHINIGGDERAVYQVNRRVRALVGAGTLTGAITSLTFAGATTTIQVGWDSGGADSSLSALAVGLLSPVGGAGVLPDNSNVNVNSVSISSSLVVTGVTRLDGVLSLSGTLIAKLNAQIQGALSVSGSTHFAGTVDIAGAASISAVNLASGVAATAILNDTLMAAAVGTNIYTGGAVKGYVDAVSASLSAAIQVPIGGIIMWAGSLGAWPANWALCDGTGGTPDLRERFIYGAAAAEQPGSTGGALVATTGGTSLTEAQIPAHTHAMFHRPDVSIGAGTTLSSLNQFVSSVFTPGDDSAYQMKESSGGSAANVGQVLTIGAGATHSHSISNLPPYFKLAFIQRIS